MPIKENNSHQKLYTNVKVKQKLVINPQHTLLGLKRALPVIEEISRQGGTILLVGNNTMGQLGVKALKGVWKLTSLEELYSYEGSSDLVGKLIGHTNL